ncbi:hypothetical protein V1477_003764 [Vespula maculifrons]|uniref:Uncharacterized protein n=3 Tax=Vespula TaxID=7451 RepID=A0A834PCK9_VESPE|nr:hypothetical protein HZH66_002976 [Vespula vulgaris]KAF7435468.1 hypothetical protein H0235_003659 [Vespula pensylvanica]
MRVEFVDGKYNSEDRSSMTAFICMRLCASFVAEGMKAHAGEGSSANTTLVFVERLLESRIISSELRRGKWFLVEIGYRG